MNFMVSLVMFYFLLNGFVSTQTLIQDSCKKAACPDFDYNFCFNTLTKDPQSKTAKSLEDLVFVSTKIAAAKVTETKGIVEQILKNKKGIIAEELRYCIGLYDDASDALKDALQFVKSHDYGSAIVQFGSALNAPPYCEDEIKERTKIKSPITNENNILFKTLAIPLAFADML